MHQRSASPSSLCTATLTEPSTIRFLMRRVRLTCIGSIILAIMPSSSSAAASSRHVSTSTAKSTTTTTTTLMIHPPPIVYTIAGSDSGGGAGIQADLHAIQAMGCHGCSAITCLTAQNSCGVSDVFAPPASFLRAQLDSLAQDLPARAIKIGMLGTRELAETVGDFLRNLTESSIGNTTTRRRSEKPWVVLDPVMISTSGHKLIDDDAQQAMIDHVFPCADVLTPNKYEAEALLGRKLLTYQDVEQGARDLLAQGVRSVLIKGGHTLTDELTAASGPDVNATVGYAQDYFLSSVPLEGEERLCDGARGVWLRSERYDSIHTHGTGCTLSSVIASALALGHQRRQIVASDGVGDFEGATSAMTVVDACCLAKAYVSVGIGRGIALGQGPGPVAQTEFPSSYRHYPTIAIHPDEVSRPAFRPLLPYSLGHSSDVVDETPVLGRILPIVDSEEWIERLVSIPGLTDIQLRFKDTADAAAIQSRVERCEAMCRRANVRLWINDHWKAAIDAGCFGVHVGQEDLAKCIDAGGLQKLRNANVALGISTHSYGELSAALAVKPSYISLGPVFGTASKRVSFDPQGLSIVSRWRRLIPPQIPFVTIGGIGDEQTALQNRHAGADCVALIGAVTTAHNIADVVQKLNDVMI